MNYYYWCNDDIIVNPNYSCPQVSVHFCRHVAHGWRITSLNIKQLNLDPDKGDTSAILLINSRQRLGTLNMLILVILI